MAKDAASRPQSAAEAWETLEELALSVAGPRWRRASALPDLAHRADPRPLHAPPSTAVPSDPVFETFHAPPAADAARRRPVGAAAPRAAPPPRRRRAVARGRAAAATRAVPPRRPAAPPPASPVALVGAHRRAVRACRRRPSRRGRGAAAFRSRRRCSRSRAAVSCRHARRRGARSAAGARVSHAAVATVTPLDAGKVRVTLPPGWDALSLPVNVPGLPRERAAAPGGKESAGVVLVGMAPRDAHNRPLLSPRVGKAKPTR